MRQKGKRILGLNTQENINGQIERIFKLCKVSMCPPQVDTDTSYLEKNSPIMNGDNTHFVIEFGSDQTEILVSEGQHIKLNDPIAYIRGIPVKSTIEGKIRQVNDRYVIGDYDIDASSYIGDFDESTLEEETPFDKLGSLLMENQYCTAFIKDYILRFRFADFASNTIDNFNINSLLSFKSTENIADDYEDDADDINKKYEKKIKKICKKDNVKTRCENDDLLGLKSEIDDARKEAFDKIIYQYNHTESYGYTSGKVSDFMLYDLYMNYITDDDFFYDTENPYVVKLFHYINDFLRIRSKVELNGTNIESLISNFNSLCRKKIRKYLKQPNDDYYSYIKSMFMYDFYTNDEDDLIQSTIDGKDRVTLYSKVLDYLKNLTRYQKPKSAEEKYKDMDVETLLSMEQVEETESEKKNEELLKDLKKISLMFVNLRKIEVDSDSDDYYQEYISKDDLETIFSIKDALSIAMIDIKEFSLNTMNPVLLSFSEPIKKYLGALKGMTDNEARILRELSDKAVNWYLENYEAIDSGSIFDEFKEAEWSSPSTIKKDNVPHDFFYIEEPKTNEEQMQEAENAGNYGNGITYEFTEDSIKTKHGINSYPYWLKYFTVATLVNCMLPMYWSTGLPPPVGPMMLPIIFIPIVVISGRVIIVIGLGVCGVCPMPMIYFVNVGDTPACIIPVISLLIDMLKKIPGMIVNAGMLSVKGIISGLIKATDSAINGINSKIDQIEKDCYNLSVGVEGDEETKRALRKRKGLDSTTHKRKNEVG